MNELCEVELATEEVIMVALGGDAEWVLKLGPIKCSNLRTFY